MTVIRFPGDRFDRHGPDPIPLITVPVVDVTQWENFAEAIDHARKLRGASND